MKRDNVLKNWECCLKCGTMVPKGQLASHTCPKVEKAQTWMEKNLLAKKNKAKEKLDAEIKDKNSIRNMNVTQLKEKAKDLKIDNSSRMPKEQLIEEIEKFEK